MFLSDATPFHSRCDSPLTCLTLIPDAYSLLRSNSHLPLPQECLDRRMKQESEGAVVSTQPTTGDKKVVDSLCALIDSSVAREDEVRR